MDENYYVLNVKVRENLTDMRAVERMKAWNFTMKEWQAYIKVTAPFYNKYAERIVRFFVEYDKVDLCPDLFGAYEPLKETFDKKSIEEPSSCIAFPAGTLMMKKRRRFDVAIENQYYGVVFDPQNNYMVIPSKRKIGEYLGNIRIIIRKNTTKFTLEQLQTIVDDMCEYLETDYGVITHWDNYLRKDIELLYLHKQHDYENSIGLVIVPKMVSPFMSGGNTSPLSVSIYEVAIKELNRKGNNGKDICVE